MARTFFGPPDPAYVEHWECSDAEYHASPGISRSMLWDYLSDPALFCGRYVTEVLPVRKASSSMEFGTEVHQALLDGYVVMPPTITRAAGKEYQHFKEDHPDKFLVKHGSPLHLVIQSVESHGAAKALLANGLNEYSIRWTQENGLLLRCRVDCLQPGAIVDVKTSLSADARVFSRSILKYGYHVQSAVYQDGVERLTGKKLPFVFVVVQNVPPYRVACYEIDDEFISAGRAVANDACARLADSLMNDRWEDATKGQIVVIPKPAFVTNTIPQDIETSEQEIEVEYRNSIEETAG